MGESILDAQNLEDKMGETASSNPVLDVSVSFGRFANDSLSWEKWSSFSPNKYLEEVEKCATRGSVAKKAAYFEAHYRKIAARKAEQLLDQDKKMDNDHSRSNDQSDGDLIRDNCKTKSEFHVSECHTSAGVVVNQEENSLANEESGTFVGYSNGDVATSVMCQSSSIEGIKEAESRSESFELDKQEEPKQVLVKEEEEIASMGMKDALDLMGKEIEDTRKDKEETVKLNLPKDSHKITPVNKDRNISRIKKKPTSSSTSKAPLIAKASPISKASPITKSSPTSKAPQFSTPKVSKPTSTSISVSSLRSSTKMANSSSLLRSKNFPAVESKKVAPKSLHMSLSLVPSSSDPASLTTTRKSLIMEKMGDKDIVKRAFKTFQSNYNQLKSSGEERSPASKQVPLRVTEPGVSTSITPQKENGGSFKATSVEKKYAKAAPSSFALKSNERTEKRRVFPKKAEDKSTSREAERRRLQTKPKEDKEAEIKKIRQNLDFKSTSITSMPAIYRGQKITKGSVDKGSSKNQINW